MNDDEVTWGPIINPAFTSAILYRADGYSPSVVFRLNPTSGKWERVPSRAERLRRNREAMVRRQSRYRGAP